METYVRPFVAKLCQGYVVSESVGQEKDVEEILKKIN